MSARQFYITMFIGVISLKIQKLPCWIASYVGKDAWIIFLLYIIVNIVGILLAFFIFKYVKPEIVLKSSNNKIFNILRTLFMFATAFYFLGQATLVYEHIQSLFSNALFDNLSWPFFSLFLLFTVFFLSHRGIENIAISEELYFLLILISHILISLLSINNANFSTILPFETINFKSLISSMKIFNGWFGDFFFVLFVGMKAKDIKLSKTLFFYILSMLFITFMTIEFISIYDKYASVEPGLISVLSEQSLLGVAIGRVDWFLILFAEIGAILSCSVGLYLANTCIQSVFVNVKSIYIKIINALIIYFADIFFFVDMNKKINFYCGIMSNFSIVMEITTFAVLTIIAITNKSKHFANNKLGVKL